MTEYYRIKNIPPETLDEERSLTLSRLSDLVSADCLFEVGSTAVEGVIGKQDLDFLVRVKQDDFLFIRNALDQAFSRNPEQISNDQYQGYTVDSELDVAIQLTIEGGPYDDFVAFLSELREKAELREEYNELKLKYDGLLMSDYRDAKHEFIERVLASCS